MKKQLATAILYGIPMLAVVGLIAFVIAADGPTEPVEPVLPLGKVGSLEIVADGETAEAPGYLGECVEHGDAISYHVHPLLTIRVDGKDLAIPANVGVSRECMRVLHTHDATGTIHVEYPTPLDATLGDFLAVWGKPIDSFGALSRMTVNGAESAEGSALVLRDGDKIVLEFETAGD